MFILGEFFFSFVANVIKRSGITPPDVMAMDVKRIYDRVKIIGITLTAEERREERQKILDERQFKWNTETKEGWTLYTYQKCLELR